MPRQTDLFDDPGAPDGFALQDGFLSAEQEAQLLSHLRELDYQAFQFHGFEGLRQVAYFGWRYDFTAGRVEPADPIPDFLLPLRERAVAFAGLPLASLEHVLVTHYPPGAPIGWHRDRPQFEDVIGVSLGSPATFRMRRKDGAAWRRWSVTLEPRSIYRLGGEARRQWEHSIPPAPAQRYSITFRSLVGPRTRI